jgi:hypothetical protein
MGGLTAGVHSGPLQHTRAAVGCNARLAAIAIVLGSARRFNVVTEVVVRVP